MTKSDGIILTEGLIICQQHAFGDVGIWVVDKDKIAVIEMKEALLPGTFNHVSTVYRDREVDWPGYANNEIIDYMRRNWHPRGIFRDDHILGIVKKYAPVMFSN